jgi:acetolactate synthase-1/3 small subunit
VIKLLDLTEHDHIEREMMLVKAQSDNGRGELIKHMADIFGARIIDVTTSSYTIELTGSSKKLNAFIEALNDVPLVEVVRSGAMGIARGDKSLRI